MFKKGDPVLHPQHGAGIVTSTRKWKVEGIQRSYYCIELMNDSGMLMIPVEQVDDAGLRPANSEPERIATILSRTPEELDADYRVRHVDVAAKVHSGDPELVAQALRDLTWRKHVDKLSMRDEQLKDEAHSLLASIFALEHNKDLDSATEQLNALIQSAIPIPEHAAVEEAG